MISTKLILPGVKVIRGEHESVDNLLRRFRQVCEKNGIQQDIKKRRYFIPASELRRERLRRAKRKARLERERIIDIATQ